MNSDDDLITGVAAARLLGQQRSEHLKPLIENGMLQKRYTPMSTRPKYRRGDVMALITTTPPKKSLVVVNK
jgi:hypothetical protein